MQLTERERHDAYEALAETFGLKTDIVIAMLQPASDLVTKDVMAAGMADLRTEMAVLRTDLETEIAGVRTEMADLRTEVKSEISTAIQAQTRTMMFTIMGAVVLVLLANALQTAFA